MKRGSKYASLSYFQRPQFGLFTGKGFFFIIESPLVGGGGLLTLPLGCAICRRIVSVSGIPGVGVAPGFIGLFISFGSGIPGVGVAPLGAAFIACPGGGMPGVVFAEGGIGLVESPGGKLLESTFA